MAPTTSSSKLLQMIKPVRVQADEEIENLTEAQLKLFLKLCRDPSVAKQLATGSSDTMTSSTVTSETSSQDNSYVPAQAIASHSPALSSADGSHPTPSQAKEYQQTTFTFSTVVDTNTGT